MNKFIGKYGLPDVHYTFEEHPTEYIKNSDKVDQQFLIDRINDAEQNIDHKHNVILRAVVVHPKADHTVLNHLSGRIFKQYAIDDQIVKNKFVDTHILTGILKKHTDTEYPSDSVVYNILSHHSSIPEHIDMFLHAKSRVLRNSHTFHELILSRPDITPEHIDTLSKMNLDYSIERRIAHNQKTPLSAIKNLSPYAQLFSHHTTNEMLHNILDNPNVDTATKSRVYIHDNYKPME